MDYHEAQNLKEIADKQIEHTKEYEVARKRAGIAKAHLHVLLSKHIKEYRQNKKNLGVEMAILMLMGENEQAEELYIEWSTYESKYKAIEKLIDAYASKISLEQSILKYIGHGEKWGG